MRWNRVCGIMLLFVLAGMPVACGPEVDVVALYRDAAAEAEACVAGFRQARTYDQVTAVGKRWFEANRAFELRLEEARRGSSGAFSTQEAQEALAAFTAAHQRLIEEQARSYERFLGNR